MQTEETRKTSHRKAYLSISLIAVVVILVLAAFLYWTFPSGRVIPQGTSYTLSFGNDDFELNTNVAGPGGCYPNPSVGTIPVQPGGANGSFCVDLINWRHASVSSVTATIMPGGQPLCQHLPANITCADWGYQGVVSAGGLSFCVEDTTKPANALGEATWICGNSTTTLCLLSNPPLNVGTCYNLNQNFGYSAVYFISVTGGAVAGSTYVIQLTFNYVDGYSSSIYVPVPATATQ
jgi:hypothetical protein